MFKIDTINMDNTLLPAAAALLLIMYVVIISSLYNNKVINIKIDNVSHTVKASSGEIETLKTVTENDTPYDLFTLIYPALKDMDNKLIDELIDIISTYNSNWISEYNE